jgi:two-component system response regulator BaeR
MLNFLTKQKILVVEDDAPLCRALMDALKREGYAVVKTSSGTDVVSAVQLEKPDIVLLDVLLPGQDGETVLDTLRSQEMNFQKPIIILTNLAPDNALQEHIEAHEALYLNKSKTSLSEVISVIEHALNEVN